MSEFTNKLDEHQRQLAEQAAEQERQRAERHARNLASIPDFVELMKIKGAPEVDIYKPQSTTRARADFIGRLLDLRERVVPTPSASGWAVLTPRGPDIRHDYGPTDGIFIATNGEVFSLSHELNEGLARHNDYNGGYLVRDEDKLEFLGDCGNLEDAFLRYAIANTDQR